MRKTYSAKTLLLLGSLAAATAARAQDAPRVQNKVLGANGQPELVRFAAGKATYRGTADGEQLLRQQLALGTDDKMLPTRAETDELASYTRNMPSTTRESGWNTPTIPCTPKAVR